MKRILSLALVAGLLSGCSLWPKKVEYGQSKVKPVPVLPASGEEHQRQAAQYVAEQVEIASHAVTNENVANAAQVAPALSESLGPPAKPWSSTSTNLANTLHRDQAKLNEKLDDYREDTQKLVGKKIEGTGIIQVGYFTQWAILFGVILVIGFALKVYGMINPVVGAATGTIGRLGSSALSTATSELVAGGAQFLNWVESSNLAADTKNWIVSTFKIAHQTQQSPTTQATVDKLVPLVAPTTIQPPTTPVTTTTVGSNGAPVTVTTLPPIAGPGSYPASGTGSAIPTV